MPRVYGKREAEYRQAIKKLAGFNIDPDEAKGLFERINDGAREPIKASIFITNLAEMLDFLLAERNVALPRNNPAFFRISEILKILEKNQKLIKRRVNSIREKFAFFDSRDWCDFEGSNILFKDSNFVFTAGSVDNLLQRDAILSCFTYLGNNGEVMNLSKYIFSKYPSDTTSPEKLFARCAYMRGKLNSNFFRSGDVQTIRRSRFCFEDKQKIDEANIIGQYPMPKYDKDHPEDFIKKVRMALIPDREEKLKED